MEVLLPLPCLATDHPLVHPTGQGLGSTSQTGLAGFYSSGVNLFLPERQGMFFERAEVVSKRFLGRSGQVGWREVWGSDG